MPIVDEAADGNEAIDKVKALKPRIVLMDLVMPGMDGSEATRTLRSSYTKETLAIIGISASALASEQQQFLDTGLNACIAKPFRETVLLQTIGNLLGSVFVEAAAPAAPEDPDESPFRRVPGPMRAAILDATIRADCERILALAAELTSVDPFAATVLTGLAERFEYDRIHDLLAAAPGQEERPS